MPWVQYIGRRSLAGDVLGPNLVSNGHFTDGTTGWTAGNTAVLAKSVGGKLSVTNGAASQGYAYASFATVAGQLYKVSADVGIVTASSVTVWAATASDGSGVMRRVSSATSTTIEFYFIASGATTFILLQNADSTISVVSRFDNVSLRNVVARGHSTTIEHVLNPDFVVDSQWTKGTGWTIGSGVASSDGTQTTTSNLVQQTTTGPGVVRGKTYDTVFTVSGRSAGSVKIIIGDASAGTTQSTNATFSESIVADYTSESANGIYLQASADFIGSVDNVSVKLAANNTWSLDFDIWLPMQPGRSARTNAVQMLDSSTDTQYWSSKQTLNVQTDMMEYGEWQFMEEFIDNATDGQTVIFDPYGTESQPKDPRSYILIGSSMTHVVGGDTTERRQYQLQFREA